MAFYLGRRKQGDLVVFRSPKTPTKVSHGQFFIAVIGPFQSKVGASYYALHGRDNPELSTAEDVERLARADPLMEGAIAEESMNDEELAIALEYDAQEQLEYSPHPIQQGAIACPINLNINA